MVLNGEHIIIPADKSLTMHYAKDPKERENKSEDCDGYTTMIKTNMIKTKVIKTNMIKTNMIKTKTPLFFTWFLLFFSFNRT